MIVLLSKDDWSGANTVVNVRYTADLSGRTRFEDAYVKTADDRVNGIEDGTFRSFTPFVPKEGGNSVGKKSYGELFKSYLKKWGKKVSQIANSATNEIDKETGSCGVSRTIYLGGEGKTGDLGVLGVASASGKGGVEWKWEKPIEVADQFAIFGPNSGYHLTIAGVAECDKAKKYPIDLELADITIGGSVAGDQKPITVTSDEIFDAIRGLKNKASDVNKRRDERLDLTQMFNVPKKEPKLGFYYTYFDQLETYMDDRVFSNYIIPKDEKFGLTLLVGEALSAWDRTKPLQ
jgi:hypothetical protein